VNRHPIGVRRGSRRGHGIGAATASAFAQRGDVVVVSGRHDDVGERLAGGLKRAGAADSLFVHADVRFEREVAELISAAVNPSAGSTSRSTMPAPKGARRPSSG
jgi:NAD(P)-dependent dehydrogenase (short-subunit alcohol dehydrogenase family)